MNNNPPTHSTHTHSWTSSKVFRTSFWREVGKFLLVLTLVAVIGGALAGTDAALCPSPDITTDPASPAAAAAAAEARLSTKCVALACLLQLVRAASIGCALVWAWYIGGPRRTQMRRLLGIADSGAGGDCCTCGVAGPLKGARSDACLHFWCLWCAVAQEMRTVMHLQSVGKLPSAPPEGYEPLIHKAPSVDGSMSRDTATSRDKDVEGFSRGGGDAMV